MRYGILLFLITSLALSCSLGAQTVRVIYKGELLNGPDGIAVDHKQQVYVANWGKNGDGTTVVKFDSTGKGVIYLSDLKAPDGLAFDRKNRLYMSEFGSGNILRSRRKNKASVYLNISGNPSALLFNGRGHLYVSDFGRFNGSKVFVSEKSGALKVFADSLQVPLGLETDSLNNIYVSCFGSGIIYRIDSTGTKIKFAEVSNNPPARLQYMVFRGNELLVPSYGHNCIYAINPSGQVRKIDRFINSGTGEVYTLNGPNSIALNAAGQLWVTEFNRNSLLLITL